MSALVVLGVLAAVALLALAKAVHVVPENQRLAVTRLGRFFGIQGPGIVVLAPIVDAFVRHSLDPQELRVSCQVGTLQSDKRIEALVRYRILDPEKAHLQCASPQDAIQQSARFAIQKLSEGRPGAAAVDVFTRQAVRDAMDEITTQFGIKVLDVELQLQR